MSFLARGRGRGGAGAGWGPTAGEGGYLAGLDRALATEGLAAAGALAVGSSDQSGAGNAGLGGGVVDTRLLPDVARRGFVRLVLAGPRVVRDKP